MLTSILIGTLITYLLLTYDPSAIDILNNPNPVLDVPTDIAWVMIAVSFLIVGTS